MAASKEQLTAEEGHEATPATTSPHNVQQEEGPQQSVEACTLLKTRQVWTESGFPIVDDKYLDLTAGTVKTLGRDDYVYDGPPALEIYWNNRLRTDLPDQFRGVVTSAYVGVSEYLRRIGRLLAMGKCEIMALNATKYAVNVVVSADVTTEEMMEMFEACKLRLADKEVDDPPYPTFS